RSWAVRALGCDAGIIVTASHNPAKYNGYKVYGSDGCQVTLEAAEKILGEIEKLNIFADIKSGDFEQFVIEGKIKYIGQDVIDEYIANVKKQSIHPELCAKSGL
ncbi:phospho-sugar mutase, partial [[Eubacterium] siraeum]|nr:phospho-sugar mutase [[Eubacterium] siraeum]